MIISASYKTDIPAFYSDWFMGRFKAGHCAVKNPYNGRYSRVSLMADSMRAIVFWTRNPAPLQKYLAEIADRVPFVFQITLTGYGPHLESSVVSVERSLIQMRKIASQFGAKTLVWRYDPIVLSDDMDACWHLANFSSLAAKIEGLSDEVVVSFAQPYRKSKRNLRHRGINWQDSSIDEKKELLSRLMSAASARRMKLTLCSQPDLTGEGISAARCIDPDRLAALGVGGISKALQGNRPGCLCVKSRDIGAYNSCPHGCGYCYAVSDRARAQNYRKNHQVSSVSM